MRKPSIAVGVVLLVLVGFSVRVSGQSPTIQSIQATINGLVTTVNGLVQAVNAIGAAVVPGNVLVTSPLPAQNGDTLTCTAINTSATTRNISVGFHRVSDGVAIAFQTGDDVRASMTLFPITGPVGPLTDAK